MLQFFGGIVLYTKILYVVTLAMYFKVTKEEGASVFRGIVLDKDTICSNFGYVFQSN